MTENEELRSQPLSKCPECSYTGAHGMYCAVPIKEKQAMREIAVELAAAAKSKLADCKAHGECADAALMDGECCSNECAALADALAKAKAAGILPDSKAVAEQEGIGPENGTASNATPSAGSNAKAAELAKSAARARWNAGKSATPSSSINNELQVILRPQSATDRQRSLPRGRWDGFRRARVSNLVGISVECTFCGRTKQPHGRSAPMGASYCDIECEGYRRDPQAGCLWPGETQGDFGFAVCRNATRPANGTPTSQATSRDATAEDAGTVLGGRE